MKSIKIKQINNSIYFVLSFPVIIILCIICMSCVGIMTKLINEEIVSSMITREPTVSDITLFNNDDFFGSDYYIKILFNDGNSIAVNHVDKFGKGKRMRIMYVNDYFLLISNKSTGKLINYNQELKFLSTLIGVQLETVVDIIKNYHVICNEIENWIDLTYYKQDNETYYEAKMRVILEDISPDSIISFEGQEYFVYKQAAFL